MTARSNARHMICPSSLFGKSAIGKILGGETDSSLRPLIHVERKDIRSCVMTNNVKVVFCSGYLLQVQICCKDTLLFEVWPSQDLARRADDAAATASPSRCRFVHRVTLPSVSVGR